MGLWSLAANAATLAAVSFLAFLAVSPASARDLLYDESNVTGSCFGYPNVSEAHEFFAAMAARVNAASQSQGLHSVSAAGSGSVEGSGLARYPIHLGRSIEGRSLEALCLGYRCGAAGSEPSDPSVPQALFTGLHHAREPTSLGVLYYFVRDLVQKYVRGDGPTRLLLHSRQLWFIPVVNPDGYSANCRNVQGRMVRTNMRPACTRTTRNRGPGVDLNRNYPVCFDRATKDRSASTTPCSEDYQGEHPFSEPETAAIRDLTGRQNFTFAINYHSYGKEITMPFGCKVLGKPKGSDYDVFIGLGERITALNGFMYGVGWEKPLDLYTVSGAAQDWMFQERGIYALMSEVGPLYRRGVSMIPSFWPTPDEGKAIAVENIKANTKMAWLSGPFLELVAHHVDYAPNSRAISAITVEILNAGVMPAAHWSVRAFVAKKEMQGTSTWETVEQLPTFWHAQPRGMASPYRNITVDLVEERRTDSIAPQCEAGYVLRFILLSMSGSPSALVPGKTCVRYEVDCLTGATVTGPDICDKNVHNLVLLSKL